MERDTHVIHQWTPVRWHSGSHQQLRISGWHRTREGARAEIATYRQMLTRTGRTPPRCGIVHAVVTTVTDEVQWLEEGA